MKLILHIGLSKTGSTLIQFFCHENRAKLLDNGILFPQTGLSLSPDGRKLRSSGHYFFIPALKNNQTVIFEDLHREIAKYKNVDTLLISSENFSFQPGLASSLKNTFKSYKDVKVVVYLRRQDLYLESLYSEFISGGFRKLSVNPEDFTWEYLEKTSNVICDYNELLEPWEKSFGKRNIIVRPFEKEQWTEGDLLKDFFTALKLPWNDKYNYPDRKSRNVSAPSQVNKTILYLNRVPLKDSYYRLMLSDFFENELENYPPEPKRFFFSPSHRINLLQHYDNSNALVAKKYLDRDSGALFYQPNPKKDEPWQPVLINDSDLLAHILTLFLEQKALEIEEEFSSLRQNLETFRANAWETLKGHGGAIRDIHLEQKALKDVSAVTQQKEHAASDELPETIEELSRSQNEFAENQKLLVQTQQETEIFRKNVNVAIKEQGKALKKKQSELEKYKKEQLQIRNILYYNVLTTFKHSRANLLKRLYRFLRAPRLNEAKLLHKSGLVDPYYYFKNYPQTITAGITVAEHYVRHGVLQGMNPSDNFNTLKYLAEHPDVAHDGLNPLVHFVLNRRDKKS